MKTSILILVGLATVAGGIGGWFAARRLPARAVDRPADGARRILYYQSSMHPWVRSDQPGKCTICGMDLTPVFEGEAGKSVGADMVTLSSNGVSVLGVATRAVRRGPLTRTLRVAGVIDDDDTRHRFVSAWAGGRIDELFVNYVGAEVTSGQPLARFYSPMLLEAERQYLAILGRGAGGAGGRGMPGDGGLLEASAAQRLRQLGLTDAQIAALPGKDPTNLFSEILSPTGGTVVGRFVYAGQYVMEGERLFELADFSTMWFRFDAYEQDLAWIEPGQEVAVTTPSVPGQVLKAPIRFVDPNLDPMTRSAKVRVELPNPWVGEGTARRRLLRHRLFAEARVSVPAREVLRVPRSAVLSPDGQAVVYVDLGAGAFEPRRVRLGLKGDEDYEVLEGLEEGEDVVVSGNLMIDAQAQLNAAIHQTDAGHDHGAGTNAAGTTPDGGARP